MTMASGGSNNPQGTHRRKEKTPRPPPTPDQWGILHDRLFKYGLCWGLPPADADDAASIVVLNLLTLGDERISKIENLPGYARAAATHEFGRIKKQRLKHTSTEFDQEPGHNQCETDRQPAAEELWAEIEEILGCCLLPGGLDIRSLRAASRVARDRAELAAELGVSESTISRALTAIRMKVNEAPDRSHPPLKRRISPS